MQRQCWGVGRHPRRFRLRQGEAQEARTAASSNSLNPPPSPIRLVPTMVPLTALSPLFDALHWLHSLRLAQFQLPQAEHGQSPTLASIPGGMPERGALLAAPLMGMDLSPGMHLSPLSAIARLPIRCAPGGGGPWLPCLR